MSFSQYNPLGVDIQTDEIDDLAITTAKLANLAVTAAKIAADTITAAQIAANAIGDSEMSAHTTTKLTADLANLVTGILAVVNGGTGLSALGAGLQYLRTNTGATAMEWATLPTNGFLFAYTNQTVGFRIDYYFPVAGIEGNASVTESQVQIPAAQAFTWSRMCINIPTNSLNASHAFHSRINGVNGNQTFTITIGQTGEFQDTINTDVVSNLDNINYFGDNIGATTGAYHPHSWSSMGTI